MKSLNLISKLFIAAIIWTFGFISLAIFSGNKAYSSDPEILTKIENKYDVHVDRHGVYKVFATYNSDDWKKTKGLWNFPNTKNKLIFKSYNADIKIVQSKTKEVIISAEGSLNEGQSKKLLETEMSDDELTVSEIKHATSNLSILIEVPADFRQNISVSSASGSISIEGLNLALLDLKTISGDISLKDMNIKTLETKTVSGEITADTSEISEILGKSVSGDIKISNKIATDVSLKTISGNINLTLTQSDNYRFNLKSVSGNIENKKSDNKNGTKNVEISTTSGDITIL
jgi:DUF4097 and DUF4098 domain-containing protein YvlB